MENYRYRYTLPAIFIMVSTIILIGYAENSVNAIPTGLFKDHYLFGPLVGITTNDTGQIDWVLTGIWRSSLTNDTNYNTNKDNTLENQTTGTFNAAIEMIKPDGTSRHAHTLTDFVITNSSQDTQNGPTIYNGTSTISLRQGPVIDIPTTIQKSNNSNVFKILLDPESVDYHFGKSPLIYGISANHDLMKKPRMEVLH